MNVQTFITILKQNKLEIIPECLTDEFYNSQQSRNRIPSNNMPNIVQACLSAEHVSNHQMEHGSEVAIVQNSLLNSVTINNQSSLKTDEKLNSEVMPHATEIIQC